jgi:hypothetical protein
VSKEWREAARRHPRILNGCSTAEDGLASSPILGPSKSCAPSLCPRTWEPRDDSIGDSNALIRLADEAAAKRLPAGPLANKSTGSLAYHVADQ